MTKLAGGSGVRTSGWHRAGNGIAIAFGQAVPAQVNGNIAHQPADAASATVNCVIPYRRRWRNPIAVRQPSAVRCMTTRRWAALSAAVISVLKLKTRRAGGHFISSEEKS